MTIHDLPTPAVLIDASRLAGNISSMQQVCDAHGVELWPHVKTHKLIPVLRQQLAAGAKGATFAKVSEVEALLDSGIRRVFIAHSLVQPELAPRLNVLSKKLESITLAVTSAAQLTALEALLDAADIHVDALLAVDTGLHREGCRSPEEAASLGDRIRNSHRLTLKGIYSHEGHSYGTRPGESVIAAENVHRQMKLFSNAVGVGALWPGCSVTASHMVKLDQVKAVRPGAYVFGDLALTEKTGVMLWNQLAVTILATVIDRPTPDLALIDAGSKVFSSDKTSAGISGCGLENPEISVNRVNEEHGYISFPYANAPKICDRIHFVPAHICTVINLASKVYLIDGESVIESWHVDARGCST